jgi:hypothetical protein
MQPKPFPESQNHGDWRESKSRSPFFRSLLGNSGDGGTGIAIDGSGDAYITGITSSTNFPVTPGAFQTVCYVESDGYCYTAFVTEINPTGSA